MDSEKIIIELKDLFKVSSKLSTISTVAICIYALILYLAVAK
jgi:hypothetical protein